MAIDTGQFLQTFYEESYEGLDLMEAGLLSLDPDAVDQEQINGIFRAAHSIKGGSGTFGLTDIAGFTHVVETLLDQFRDGTRALTSELVGLLLDSVDCLRDLLKSSQGGGEVDADHVARVQGRLEAALGGPEPVEQAADAGASGQAATAGWKITFAPYPDLFRTGNDPIRILRELESLGELTAEADISGLPALEAMEPDTSYLRWTLELRTRATRPEIEEVFAWVEDECDLAIEPLGDDETSEQSTAGTGQGDSGAQADQPISGEVVHERRKGADRRKGGDRRAAGSGGMDGSSIRVGIDKVDSVINLVGELVITQSMLSTLGEEFDMGKLQSLQRGLAELERNTRELQDQVMRMRMLPIGFVFNRFPRMVHDISTRLDKKVDLQITGEATELDKTVIERIGDPLVHLVRNALDHGIEQPEQRVAAGKSETGSLQLCAYHKGGNIVVEVRDDGRGLDADKILAKAVDRGLVPEGAQLTPEQAHELLFLPGFSTAEDVSDISGRGVGMDVVRRNIQALGGSVDVASEPGRGSVFTVRLPLTLAIVEGQTVSVGQETYIVPLVSIIESIQVDSSSVAYIAGHWETLRWRDEHLPIVRLRHVFGAPGTPKRLEEGLVVVVEGEGRRIGLFVDELLGQQQVVIKSLEANYTRVDGISGATILGDGSVALILDVPGLIRKANQERDGYEHRKRA